VRSIFSSWRATDPFYGGRVRTSKPAPHAPIRVGLQQSVGIRKVLFAFEYSHKDGRGTPATAIADAGGGMGRS